MPNRMSTGALGICTRCIFALCAFAWVAAAAPPADPYSSEANSAPFEQEAAVEAPAPAPEAKPAEAEAPKPPEAPAAPASVETPPPATEKPAAESATASPDWWGSIRDATGAEMDKSAPSAAAGAADPTAEPLKPVGARSFLQGIYALLIVLALIAACYAVLIRVRRHAPMLAGGEYASVVGRLPLDARFALHFVRVGDKVLLLGVTVQSINILEVFDAATFGNARAEGAAPAEPQHDFLAHLRASAEALNPMTPGTEDEDIVSLRGDIERLKRYLEEGSRVDPKS